jgi:[protein-PII] uridylyltransferase
MPDFLERIRAMVRGLLGRPPAGMTPRDSHGGRNADQGSDQAPPAAPARRNSAMVDRALAMIGAKATEALLPVQSLQRLADEPGLFAERFGPMLRELTAPDLLTLALVLRDPQTSKSVLDRLELTSGARQTVEFLIRNRSQMAQIAFRRDTADPEVIRNFTSLFSTEEQLKMLHLMTAADLRAAGGDQLTPWKAELLWRLFVDSYAQLTMAYGDEVIDRKESALAALQRSRPGDISEGELVQFLEGLPRRYLTLFDPDIIYAHVRLWRELGSSDVHFSLNKKGDVRELTVVGRDKAYFFSNICGVLAYLDMDILRGYAFTSLSGVVLDVFQFTDRTGFLDRSALDPLLSDAVAGRIDITARLQEKEKTLTPPSIKGAAPVLFFDNDVSQRYTVLELIAADAPRLLHRISRVISGSGCEVDLVLISTEGEKAIDVFHLRKGSGKLTDSDQLALTEDLERMLQGRAFEAGG